MSSTDQNRSKKILVPLATMAVAAAVVVGSGATWTSTSQNHVSVTAGKIMHVNDHEGGTLTVTRLKPGISETGTVKILEGASNDLDSTLQLIPSNLADSMTAGDLKIRVQGNGVDTGTINFETLPTLNLGRLDDGYGSKDFVFTITMPSTAGTENQGKTASVDLKFVTSTTTTSESSGTTVGWN